MRTTWVVMKRELAGYFATPVAYVFLCIFLALAGLLTFRVGDLFGRGQADLDPFFAFHPWLYLFLVPALSMRTWAEERKTGTIEMLLTLPVSMGEAVVGKFLAAWAFTGLALLLTFPLPLTINWLGSPDNGVILGGYLGSLGMAGACLAVGTALSALTRNQVIAFVLTVAVLFLFVVAGTPVVVGFLKDALPGVVVEGVAALSLLTHFDAISKGVVSLADVLYFASMIVFWLFASAVIVDLRKAD